MARVRLAVFTQVGTGMRDLAVWVVVLLIQSIPYCASLLMSLVSALPSISGKFLGHAKNMNEMAHAVLEAEESAVRN